MTRGSPERGGLHKPAVWWQGETRKEKEGRGRNSRNKKSRSGDSPVFSRESNAMNGVRMGCRTRPRTKAWGRD